MDVYASIGVLLRRWYVVLLVLALTGAGGVAVYRAVPPTYEATGAAVLLSPVVPLQPAPAPTPSQAPGPVNPYLAFGGTLTVTVDVVAQVMVDDAHIAELEALGATAEYTVDPDPENRSPILNVAATADSEEEAIRTVTVVIEGIGSELARLQQTSGAPQTAWITSRVITEPTLAEELTGSRLRALVALAGLGLLTSISLAFFVESLVQGVSMRTLTRSGQVAARRMNEFSDADPRADRPTEQPRAETTGRR